MPEVGPGAYLSAVFVDLGCADLTWTVMRDYAACTGGLSEPWEYEILNAMRRAYMSEYGQTDPMRIAPVDRVEDFE